jgi:hypothetical protein
MNKTYKSLIFTDHALDRLASRTITQEMVYQTVTAAAKKFSQSNTTKFIKTVSQRKLHVVGQYLKDEKKWLIISVWVRGEDDTLPLAWRVITFPFWLLWKLLKWVFKKLF